LDRVESDPEFPNEFPDQLLGHLEWRFFNHLRCGTSGRWQFSSKF
jgi:hypothetical protein